MALFSEYAEGTPARIRDAKADVAIATVEDTTVTVAALAATNASNTNATPNLPDAAATATMAAGG